MKQKKYQVMNNMTILNYSIEDSKIKGVLLQAPDGETKFLDVKEYMTLLENTDSKVIVRFPNESYYDEILLDFDKFEVTSVFEREIFGKYGDTYLVIKK